MIVIIQVRLDSDSINKRKKLSDSRYFETDLIGFLDSLTILCRRIKKDSRINSKVFFLKNRQKEFAIINWL